MSRVTDIVLTCHSQEDELARLARVNAFFANESKHFQPICALDDVTRTECGEGGDKHMQGSAWSASINDLEPGFWSHLAGAGWEYPKALLLLVKGEEGDRWGVWRLGDPVPDDFFPGNSAAS